MIELTSHGEKIIVNTRHIAYVESAVDGSNIIFFDGRALHVEEGYDHVKSMLVKRIGV